MHDKTHKSRIIDHNKKQNTQKQENSEMLKKVQVKGTKVQTGDVIAHTRFENGRITVTAARVEHIRERVGNYTIALVTDISYKSVRSAAA